MKQHEWERVSAFFAETDENGVSNAEKAPSGFDPAHPESCAGLVFNADGSLRGAGIDIQNESVYPIEQFQLYYRNRGFVGCADFHGCHDMVFLEMYNNRLTAADVRDLPAMRVIGFQGNGIEVFDASGMPNVQGIDMGKNRLTALDTSKNPELVEFYCHVNRIPSLDLSKNAKLKYLWCFDNLLTELDTTHNPLLKHLDCRNNPLRVIRGFAPNSEGQRPLCLTAGEGGSVGLRYCPVYDAKWKETGEWKQTYFAVPDAGRTFVRWADANGAAVSTEAEFTVSYGDSAVLTAEFR